MANDDSTDLMMVNGTRPVCVPGPVIVGAGPSGLAVAACLGEKGVPSMILERECCIASLWQLKTYDRLCLHLPKQFCQLPLMPFPEEYPPYPSKQQFVSYLEEYARRFGIKPHFNKTVRSAEFDDGIGFWRVRTVGALGEEVEYICAWLIVATGENAEAVVPKIKGMEQFGGPVVHTSMYRSGEPYRGKRALVVGCGNSGMEVCLDLCNHNAHPSLLVRDKVHVLPRDMLGRSTFGMSMWLLKWLPMRIVDQILLLFSWFVLGDMTQLRLTRPNIGPLELKNKSGKTPVLDVGTVVKIRSGNIEVYSGLKQLISHKAEFINGTSRDFDVVILATGYKSNVTSWLKDNALFSKKDGLTQREFSNGWKGEYGLYFVGFTKCGLFGVSMDAKRVSEDIHQSWKAKAKHLEELHNISPCE